jgi:hypothetical protein
MHLMAHGQWWSEDAVYKYANGNKRDGYVSRFHPKKEVEAA